jgi:DNA-binding CsgD family transcriptional regulator
MPSRDEPSLVGRDAELARLVELISADRQVAVIGEAGIGKTALVRAAGQAAGRRLSEGGGFATLTHLPYLALRRAIDPGLDGDASEIAGRIEERLGPDVLFIDDLQWADRGTLDVVERLRGRVALVVAIRTQDPGTVAALDLTERLGAETIALEGLDRDAAAAIVRTAQSGLGGASVDLVVHRAGGNPLLLRELAVHGEVPTTMARMVTARLERLSPDGRRAIDLLALADRPLALEVIGPGSGEIVDAGLADVSGPTVAVRHALVGEAIRDALDADARAGLHGSLADALDDPAEIARHLVAAGRGPEAAAVALAAAPAARDARTAATLLVIAATSDPDSAGMDLRLEAANALDRISDREAVIDLLTADPDEASPEQLAEGEALLARATYALGRHDEARAHLDRARATRIEPTSPAAARVAIESAEFLVNVDGAVAEGLALLDGQIPYHGPLTPEHWSLRSIREGILMAAGQEPDLALLQQAIAGALAVGQFSTAADLVRVVGFALLLHESADAGVTFLRSSLTGFVGPSAIGPGLEVAAELTVGEQLAGRLADAVTAGDEVLERPAPLHARQAAAIQRARALAMLGRHEAAAEGLATIGPFVTDDWFGRGEYLVALADVALLAGRPDRAIEAADAAMAVPAPISGGHLLAAVTRAWAESELGTRPDIDVAGDPAPSLAGARPELAAIRSLHADEPTEAAAAFTDAAGLWRGFNEPRSVTCRWAAGEARRRSGDTAAAGSLEEALEIAMAMGFEALAVRIRRSLRLAGVRVPSPERSGRGAPLQLTRRERELLRLVGDGLSNIEIARRMGLGRPTVSRILSNAMAKLGVDSRAQAVAVAADLD